MTRTSAPDANILNPDDGAFYITDPKQFACLMSARRMDIADALANAGPSSIREIADMLGVRTTALYHHVEQLLAVGLIEEAGSRIVNRRTEKLYRTPGAVMRYGLALDDPLARDIYKGLADIQCRQAAKDFARGIGSSHAVGEGVAKNLRIYRLVGSPNAEQLAEINHHLAEVARLFWESAGQDEQPLVISTVMAPIPEPRRD